MRVMKLAVIGSGMIVNEFLSIDPYLNNIKIKFLHKKRPGFFNVTKVCKKIISKIPQ